MCQTQGTVAIPRDCKQVPLIRISTRWSQRALSVILTIIILISGIEVTGGDDDQVKNVTRSVKENEFSKNETWANEDLYLGYSGLLVTNDENRKSLLDTSSIQISHSSSKEDQKRFKRGVIHLYNMIVCANGCNPLSYKGYGCYCGFLGSGYITDGIDRCCMMHDRCYDATECPMLVQYLVPYYWKCFRGRKPVCAVEHGKWGGSGSCAQRLCECDRSFAECLSRFPCPTKKAVCTSSPWRLVQNLFMIY